MFIKVAMIYMIAWFIIYFLILANECLDLILKLAQSHSKDALDELMSYMDLLQSRNCNLYESHLISILKVMIRFVKSVGTYLPVKFVTKLFSTPSLTRQLKLSPSSSVSYYCFLKMLCCNLCNSNYLLLSSLILSLHDSCYKCEYSILLFQGHIIVLYNIEPTQEI